MKLLIDSFVLIGVIAVTFASIARCIEAWYQLSQTPNLATWASIKQWFKNFFSVEKYK